MAGGNLLFSDVSRRTARKGAEGAYVAALPPPDGLVLGKECVKDYKKAGYKESYGLYGGYSFDATRAIIHAVGEVVEVNAGRLPKAPRAKVVDALRRITFTRVMGRISIAPYGDVTVQNFAVWKIRDGRWDIAKKSLEQFFRGVF